MKKNQASGMSSIQYKSLSESLTEQLRELIIIGEFEPGRHLTETEIAQNMGVSRIVVREAMIILIREGLLVKKPNKYTSVVEFNAKDIEEIFDLRIAIEETASKFCIGNSEFIAELNDRCKAIKDLSVQKGSSTIEIMKADMAFHTYIVQSAQNSRILKVWKEDIYGAMLLLLYRYIEADHRQPLSHDELIHAFEHGNSNDIQRGILLHIEDTKKKLINIASSEKYTFKD